MSELLRSPQREEIDFNRQLQRLQELSRLTAETELWQERVDADITTDQPFVVLHPLSDLHLGHRGVDMEALGEHLRFLKNNDVYTILCGDLGDFFIPSKHPDGMMGDVIDPDDQLLLMRAFMEQYADKILAVVQDPSHCFVGDECVMVNGEMEYIKDIKVGDYLTTETVTKNHINTSTNIYKVKISKLPRMKVTGNHPFKIKSIKRGQNISIRGGTFIKVRDIDTKIKNYVVIPKQKLNGEKKVLDFKNYESKNTYHSSGVLNKHLISHVDLTKDLAYFMGWYLAEGCADKERGIRLTLSSKEVDVRNKLLDIGSKHFGFDGCVYEQKNNAVDILFNSKTIGSAFYNWFGHKAHKKKIPNFIFYSEDKIKLSFIKGYFEGDGCINKRKGLVAITSSKKLALGMFYLSLSLGKMFFSVSKRNRGGQSGIINGKRFTQKDAYFIESYHPDLLRYFGIEKEHKKNFKMNYLEDEDNYYLLIRDIETINEPTVVYNLTTNTGTFLIPFIVHNTDWVRQAGGVEAYRWATRGLGIPLLESGGQLVLTANDQRYDIMPFHQISRYNSSFNRTHSLKRARELHREADIVIGGHVHIGAMEKAVHREATPYFVQLGTFKTSDGFGTRKGMFPKPQVFFPTLLLDTHKHNVEAIEDLETAEMVVDLLDAHMRLQ